MRSLVALIQDTPTESVQDLLSARDIAASFRATVMEARANPPAVAAAHTAALAPVAAHTPAATPVAHPSLGISLDGVQIHADSHAHRAAETFSTRAFTYGKHIFLGKDETVGDLRLIAHEAAHVVQQQGVSSIHRWAPHQNDPHEREADRAAAAVVRGDKFTVSERVSQPREQRFA
jgi:hypothetical protein